MPEAEEKIEVGYRNIGSALGKDYHHKFLIYTDKNSEQHTISGWTGPASADLPFGKIHILANTPYDKNNPDHPQNLNAKGQTQHRELITTGNDLSKTWSDMVTNARAKHNIYPYDPLKQNSNTLADSVLRENGLPEPKKDGFLNHYAPASGEILDKNLKPKDPNQQGISDNLGDLLSEAEVKPNQPAGITATEKTYLTLYRGLAEKITNAGAEKFVDSMIAETTYACVKQGIAPEKIDYMDINIQTNKILVAAGKNDFVAVDAMTAAKTQSQDRLHDASELQATLDQKQHTAMPQHEHAGPMLT